jgi:hypothetical protein
VKHVVEEVNTLLRIQRYQRHTNALSGHPYLKPQTQHAVEGSPPEPFVQARLPPLAHRLPPQANNPALQHGILAKRRVYAIMRRCRLYPALILVHGRFQVQLFTNVGV